MNRPTMFIMLVQYNIESRQSIGGTAIMSQHMTSYVQIHLTRNDSDCNQNGIRLNNSTWMRHNCPFSSSMWSVWHHFDHVKVSRSSASARKFFSHSGSPSRGYRNVSPEHRVGREGQAPVTKNFIWPLEISIFSHVTQRKMTFASLFYFNHHPLSQYDLNTPIINQ